MPAAVANASNTAERTRGPRGTRAANGALNVSAEPNADLSPFTRVLAVDYGERRIGLAVSDPSATIASPAGFILRRRAKRPPIAEIIRRALQLEAGSFVLGLPLDGEGDETDRSREVRVIAAEIGRRTGRTVHLVDERFTTAAALRAVKAMGGSTRGRKGDVDALAATVLLQHALNVIK